MRNEISLTDEQIETIFDDEFRVGVTVDGLKFTRDTLADFDTSSASWAISGSRDEGETETGHRWLRFDDAQATKGAPRRDVYVIDFGTVRAVYA